MEDILKKADEIEEKMGLNQNLVIDINNLHTELQYNSEMGFRFGQRAGKLKYIVDQLKELKKQTKAILIRQCVENPELCDPKTNKFTESKADAYYRGHEDYKMVVDKLLEAEYELLCLENVTKSCENRKWALSDLVKLAMSEYFESTESKKTRSVLEPEYLSGIDSEITLTENNGKKNDSKEGKEDSVNLKRNRRRVK